MRSTRARALALPSRSKFSRMNFAPPRAFARVVVALLALLLPTPARAENCGDPLSSCYVGNARAEDQERDSRQKFGQRSEYRPTPIRGQRRLDRFEPVDVTTGPDNGIDIVIEGGLAEGDVISLTDLGLL